LPCSWVPSGCSMNSFRLLYWTLWLITQWEQPRPTTQIYFLAPSVSAGQRPFITVVWLDYIYRYDKNYDFKYILMETSFGHYRQMFCYALAWWSPCRHLREFNNDLHAWVNSLIMHPKHQQCMDEFVNSLNARRNSSLAGPCFILPAGQ
jgi:hypothetical protein